MKELTQSDTHLVSGGEYDMCPAPPGFGDTTPPWGNESLETSSETIITTGSNPFADDSEGQIPYVRYEQDL